MVVAGNSGSAEEAAERFGSSTPDAVVVVEDLGNARTETQSIRRRFPRTRIVVVAAVPTPVEVREALSGDIDGVVLKDEVKRCLALAVRVVCSDQIVLPGSLRPSVSKPTLSTREKQVLAMVVMGFTNQEVARRLHVTESTVKSHLSSAFKKLGVRSRAEATQVILDPQHGLGTGILAISDEAQSPG
jgi:DNA-binding NarL/FixJ family response regulator